MNRFKPFIAPLVALVVIAFVSLAFFWPDAIDGNVLQQHDMQQGIANSHELTEHKEATGRTAWWTDALFGGMPAFQIAPDYPSTHLFSWITTVYGLCLPAPANLLAMMMVGMFILLMVMKMRPWVSLIGAIAWGLSSYFVIIIGAGHIWKFVTLSYIPPTIAGLILIYRGRRLAGTGVAALFMMLQIASNHVQMTYYFAWVMAGFIIAYGIEAWRSKSMRRWGVSTAVFVGAMALAVAANSPSLYHTYKYSKETIRGGHSELAVTDDANSTDGLDRDYITQYSYQKSETFTLLIPDIKGGTSAKPLTDTDKGKQMMEKDSSLQMLNELPQYFGGREGTSGPVYIGAIIMALALFGAIVVRGPVKWMLVVLTVLSIGLAWGRNMQWLTDLFIDVVPMYSQFRTVESILVIAQFTLPLLAVMGLHKLLTDPNASALLKPLYISFGLCALFCLVAIAAPGAFGSDGIGEGEQEFYNQLSTYKAQGYDVSQYYAAFDAAKEIRMSMVRADALRSLLFVFVGGGALWLMATRKIRPIGAVAIVGVAVLIDLFAVDKRYLNSDNFVPAPTGDPIAATAIDRAILSDATPGEHYRVMDFDRFGQADPSYFHKTIGGYHAAKLTRIQDLIDNQITNPNVFNMLNAKYLVYQGELMPNPDALGNAWFVDRVTYVDSPQAEMDALSVINPATDAVADARFRSILGIPSEALPGDAITLTSYAPDRLEYRAETAGGALAVFSEIYFPWGWNVTIDGEPAELGRVNYVLRALPVPAGKHTIVMEFKPESLAVTNGIAYGAIIIVYLLLAAGLLLYFYPQCRFLKKSNATE